MVRLYQTFSNNISSGMQGMQDAICTTFERLEHIDRTLSNLLELHTNKDRRYIDFFHTCSGWFDKTEPSPAIYICSGIQGVQDAICTSSGRFEHIEPFRTIERYIDFFHTCLGWFDKTEPSPAIYICSGIQGVQDAICTSSGRFEHIEPSRTIERYIDFFHTCLGWFDCTEPFPTTSLREYKVRRMQYAPVGKVRYSRATPNMCGTSLYTFLSLSVCSSRRFNKV